MSFKLTPPAVLVCLGLLTTVVATHGAGHWPPDERFLTDRGEMVCAAAGNSGGPQAVPHFIFSWHDNGIIHLNATGVRGDLPACTFSIEFLSANMQGDPNEETPWGITSTASNSCLVSAPERECTAGLDVSWWVFFWDNLHTLCPDDGTIRFKFIEIWYGFFVNGGQVGGPQKIIVEWSCIDPAPGEVPPMPCTKVGDTWACPGV